MCGRWFFFYGTLMQDHHNAMTRALLPLLEGGKRASTRGQLRAVRTPQGCYPALCRGTSRISGRLYRAGPCFTARHLRLLDAYEEFDPRRPSRSEYVRRAVRVKIAGGRALRAQTYCYNRPAHSGLRVVPGGDFSVYITRRKLGAFGC